MKVKLSVTGGDVHVMDDHMLELAEDEEVPLPQAWFQEFRGVEGWDELLFCLSDGEGLDIDGKTKPNGEALTAPKWFVENWAKAAIHAASNCATTGSGIIAFQSWEGYRASPWCEIEFRLCKVLSAKYPRSVYVVTGVDNVHKISPGYYMKSAAQRAKEQQESEDELSDAGSTEGETSVATSESSQESFESLSERIRRVFGKTSANQFDAQKEVEATLQGWDERDSEFGDGAQNEERSSHAGEVRRGQSVKSGETKQTNRQSQRGKDKEEYFEEESKEIEGHERGSLEEDENGRNEDREEDSDEEKDDDEKSEAELSLHYF